MRFVAVIAASVGALALAGAATDAAAQTRGRAPAVSLTDIAAQSPSTPTAAQRRGLRWNENGRWGLNFNLNQPVGREADWGDVEAGAYYRLSPRLRVGAAIVSSRRRYVAGVGKSAAFASLLAGDLAAGLANVFQIDGQGLHAIDVLTDVRPQDVLVCFSVRRYRVETVELGGEFLRRGGSLVVVTDSPDAPLALDGAVVIAVDTGSGSFADSPTSVAAVCQLLSSLTIASAKGARRRLQVRDALGDTLHQYLPLEAGAGRGSGPGAGSGVGRANRSGTDEGESDAH